MKQNSVKLLSHLFKKKPMLKISLQLCGTLNTHKQVKNTSSFSESITNPVNLCAQSFSASNAPSMKQQISGILWVIYHVLILCFIGPVNILLHRSEGTVLNVWVSRPGLGLAHAQCCVTGGSRITDHLLYEFCYYHVTILWFNMALL